MPLLKCLDCMHEWEGQSISLCDWCGAKGIILDEKTPFEKMLSSLFAEFKDEDIAFAEDRMDDYCNQLNREDNPD